MYEEIKEERKNGYTTKNIILITLSVLFFVFLLMWLFPTNNEIKKGLKPFYNQLFTQNINSMKDAAKSYYTLQRLPKNLGDKTKMTLEEMLELKIILPLMDSNGKNCDIEKSYVEVRKDKDEYVMKIKLHCTDKQDYVLVYMGCYDYCSTTICEKKETTTSKPTNPANPNPNPNPQPDKKYTCEYLKVTNGGYSPWSSFSAWTEDIHYANDLKQVENKTETKEESKFIDDTTKPIYIKVKVKVDEKIEKVCTATTIDRVPTGQYVYKWVNKGEVVLDYIPVNTTAVVYTYMGIATDYCKENCSSVVYKRYKKEVLEKTPVYKEVVKCTNWEEKITPIYVTVDKLNGYEQKEIKIITVKNLYRFATRTLLSGSEDRKWSNCNDSTLLNNGYQIVQKIEVK